MCAERAARYCKSAGINLERSMDARREKRLAKMEKVRTNSMEEIIVYVEKITVTLYSEPFALIWRARKDILIFSGH